MEYKETEKTREQTSNKEKPPCEDLEELEELRLRFNSLFEHTNDAILLADFESSIVLYANSKALKLFGYTEEEIYTKQNDDLVASEEIIESRRRHNELLKSDVLPLYERTIVKKNGERTICEVNISKFYDPLNNRTLIQSILRDISSRKESEYRIIRDRKLFHNIALSAIKSRNLWDFSNEVLEIMVRYLAFDFGSVRLFNNETKKFDLISSYNIPEEILIGIEEVNFKDDIFLIEKILKSKSTLIIPDFINNQEIKKYQEFIKSNNISSLVIIPILDNESEVKGLIQMTAFSSYEFTKNEIEFFDSIAAMFSSALDKYMTENALQDVLKNQQETNRIISLSPMMVFLWKNEKYWPIEYVSENISIMGYKPEDLYSRETAYSSIVHHDDVRKLDKEIRSIDWSDNKSLIHDHRIVDKFGKIHWVTAFVNARKNSENKITHYYGIVLDITEKKIAEENLLRERKVLEILANATSISTTLPELSEIVLKDITNFLEYDLGLINVYNPETRLLVPVGDYRAREYLGDPLPIVSIDDPGYLITYSARTKKPIFAPDISKLNDIEKDILKTVKQLKLKSAIVWPILDSNNELLAILQMGSYKNMNVSEEHKIVFDAISNIFSRNFERLIAQEEKQLSDEKFRAFAEQSLAGMFLFKEEGEIFFVNQRLSEISGYSMDEITRMKFNEFLATIHPHAFSEDSSMLDILQMIKGSETLKTEEKIISKNGEMKWVTVSLTPFKIKDDSFFATLMLDTTKEKQAEEKLKELNRDLENRVKERTAQLEIVNKELEAFSYSVSHDLRTPLRSIDGFSQLLHADYAEKIDSIGRDYLNRIRNSTQKMGRLIDDMLNLSKLSRKDLRFQKVNLSTLANSIIKDLQEQYPARKVKIKIKRNMVIFADPVLIGQLLANILSNAWKFTRKTPQAFIEFSETKIDDQRVFYVKDNGAGFDMAYEDKLFAVFQRLHSQDDFEGTGVGLAIVKRIADRHQGKVWAKSEIDKGAIFYFQILGN